jgi:putative pyruvate formate lyase activating enzyme
MKYEPGYLRLLANGELEKRVHALNRLLERCTVCPRNCLVNRLKDEQGYCLAGRQPYVVSVCDHHGEEPVLSGTRGSGTVFFGGCNLRCVYCQNYQISQRPRYYWQFETSVKELAQHLLHLQNDLGVHNINFVSPSHFVPQMVEAIYLAARRGLHLPIVYNTNAYDALHVLKLLDGIVDIYLPDFKYFNNEYAWQYSKVKDYVPVAKAAIKEMFRQVGTLKLDDQGLAIRGLIIRHLILPNDLADSERVLRWIAKELSPQVAISLMAQYFPSYKAEKYPLLSRKIRYSEYLRTVQELIRLGFDEGFTQHLDAPEHYLPDFEKEGHPFED